MQIEKDGIVYEVVEVVSEEMTQAEREAIISVNEKKLSELWDIIIPKGCTDVMREILEEAQRKIDEKRDFLEGEIIMLSE